MISQKEYEILWDEINSLKLKKESLYVENSKKIEKFIMELRKDSGYDGIIKQIEEKQNFAVNVEILS